MGIQVSYDYAAFVALYPQFAYLTSAQVEQYWTLATTFHANDGGGPVTVEAMQSTLLNLATAHIIQLFAPRADAQPAPDIVGRIASASQGAVSVSAEMQVPAGSAQWWNQTPYGAAYWLATAPFRTMRYLPGPRRLVNPWPVAGTLFVR